MGVGNCDRLLEQLQNKEYDFILIEGNFKKKDYEHRLLAKEEMVIVSGHPMEQVEFGELLGETIIVREDGSGSRKVLENALADCNLTLESFNNLIEIQSISVIKELVANNRGITLMYRLAVEKELREGTLFEVPLDFKIKREFNFVMLKNNIFSENYLKFFEHAREVYEDIRMK